MLTTGACVCSYYFFKTATLGYFNTLANSFISLFVLVTTGAWPWRALPLVDEIYQNAPCPGR